MFLLRVPSLAMLCFFSLHDHSPWPFTLADSVPTSSYPPWPFDSTTCGCDYSEKNTLAYPIHVSTPKLLKLVLAFGIKNTIATGVILLITLLNVVVYKLRQLREEKNIYMESSSHDSSQCRRFSIVEIQSATHNFDDELVIGKGGFGKVYKGIVVDHHETAITVAVKRLNSKSKQGAREFWTEIEMLSKFRHTHLVSLIGYCNDFPEMILVYEYMPHGTLADHLYKIRRRNGTIISQTLSWEQRLKICIGASRGLDYLHTGTGVKHRVIHRDVKSSNILLDENFAAKISDFGLSKIGPANQLCSDVSTNVKGTFGYLDPEYFLTRRLTRKSDVYAFGVVLLEVLCGRPALDPRLEADHQALVLCSQRCIKEGTLDQIIDRSLRDQISPDCLKAFVEIAEKCLNNQASKRPTMTDVVSKLEFVMSSQQSVEESFILEEFVANVGDTDKQQESSSSNENEELIHGKHHGTPITDIIPNRNASWLPVEPDVSAPSRGKRKVKMLQARAILTKVTNILKKDSSRHYSTAPSWGSRWESLSYKDQLRRTEHFSFSPLHLTLPEEVQSLRFSVAEIQAATNYFHEDFEITNSKSSKVFKGYIDGGNKKVVIKRLKSNIGVKHYMEHDCRHFYQEIVMLSKTNHYNVMSLVGYCCEQNESCLVYDYMSNGSLYDHLYCNSSDDRLPWKRRIQICIGVARGLSYLHTDMGEQPLVHRNIKPTAVLLDENWIPKISGFDFANMMIPINHSDLLNTNDDCCTYEYTDPEYFQGLQCSEKSDVYSMGMVLMEVLCARESYQYSRPMYYMNDYEQVKLSYLLQRIIRDKTLHHCIDPHVTGQIAPECLIEFIDIALNCILVPRAERPTMSEVLQRLEFAIQLQENAEALNHHFDGNNGNPGGGGGGGVVELENFYLELSYRLDKLLPVTLDQERDVDISTSKISFSTSSSELSLESPYYSRDYDFM